MKILLSLFLVTSWAADLFVFSLYTQFNAPRHYHHLRSKISSPSSGSLEDVMNPDRVPLVKGSDHVGTVLFQPRTLSPRESCESDFSKPLLIGVVAGIFGTLFIQGFVLILFRMYHKNAELQTKVKIHQQYQHGQIPIPSAPMDFRHLEHIAMSHQAASSPVGSTASLLRIAHRRPDGSWTFTDAAEGDTRSDARSEISSISPFATPLPTPISHRFPPSPRGAPSVPHSVSIGPRRSMDTITSAGGAGYEKSVYSVHTQTQIQQTHSPMPSISRSAYSYSPHTSSIYPPQSPSASMSISAMSSLPSPKQQHQYHIQNLPPSSPPPPVPLPPLPTPSASLRSEQPDPVVDPDTQTQTQSHSQRPSQPHSEGSRVRIEDDVGSTRTGPPPYAAYIPTWREQQQMQNMPPLPFPPPEKSRPRNQ